VLADRARLVQVIDNLIGNAVKFTDEGGQVGVTAAVDGREWRIDVTDSGIGIPPGDVGRLFDRFFRASNATSAGRPGSGLGLSIVKEVAELHGGRVEVTSTLGAGTTIHLFLPATAAVRPGPDPAPEQGTSVPAGGITTYSDQ
jgi:signal transduction histidine kinase